MLSPDLYLALYQRSLEQRICHIPNAHGMKAQAEVRFTEIASIKHLSDTDTAKESNNCAKYILAL